MVCEGNSGASHELRVDGCAAEGIVIGQRQCLVVFRCYEIDPVLASDLGFPLLQKIKHECLRSRKISGAYGIRWVPKRVFQGRLSSATVERSGGVRVPAVKHIYSSVGEL